MNNPRFSIALIARNEAQSLPVLFGSLAEYLKRGGEVVIVDTGSDDDTAAVARSLGARVIEAGARFHSILSEQEAQQIHRAFAKQGEVLPLEAGQQWFHFAQARTMATEQAQCDFVLMPDASDEFLNFDIDWFDHQIANHQASGFRYSLKLGATVFSQSRFFDRRLYEWRGRTHEAIYDREDVPAADSPPMIYCDEAQLYICHHRGQKARPYMAGMALDILEGDETPRWYHYLGRECFYFELWHSAIALLQAHAARDTAWAAERNESLCLVGRSFETLGNDEAAIAAYQQAHEIDQSRREPLLRLAQVYTRQGDFRNCADKALAALEIKSRGAFTEADENYAQLPHALLYWSLFWLGQREEARLHWHKCREFSPEDARFLADAKLFGENLPAPGDTIFVK